MQAKGFGLLLLMAGLVVAAFAEPHLTPLLQKKPQPQVVQPVYDDLGTANQFKMAMTGEHAASDAAWISSVFSAAAEVLETDLTSASPVVTDRIHIERLVSLLGTITNRYTASRYPQLPPIVAGVFERFPKEQGELTPQDRTLAVQLFRALSSGASAAGAASAGEVNQ